MQDLPQFAANQRRKQRETGYEPQDIGETGATLWIAAAIIILIVAGLSLFGHDKLRNGGAPFVITPSSQLAIPHADP